MDFVLQHPAIRDHEQRREEDDQDGDLEARALDGEVRQVLLAGFGDGDADALRVAGVVPVEELALRDGGDEAADAEGEEGEAELEVVEAVDVAELRGDADEDGVEAGVEEAHEDEEEAGFELCDHD